MITVLMYAIVVAGITSRRYECMAFGTVVLGHDLVCRDLDGFAYYSSAALAGLLTIWLISLGPKTKTAVWLAGASLSTVAANLIGFAIWYMYLPPTLYDCYFVGLYSCCLLLIIKQGGDGDFLGLGTTSGGLSFLWGPSGLWRSSVFKHKGRV